jgi:porphobilinogen deaminase
VGAYATVDDGAVRLTGAVYSEDGANEVRGRASGPTDEAEAIGARLAERLGREGAYDLVGAAKERVR